MHRIVTLIDLSVKMEQHLAFIARKMDNLNISSSPEPESPDIVWLDNQEVMQALKISYRTLCRFRQEGVIPARRIRGKFYYKDSDIEEVLNRADTQSL